MFILAYIIAGLSFSFITYFGISLTKGRDFVQKYKKFFILPFFYYILLLYLILFAIELKLVYYGAIPKFSTQSILIPPKKLNNVKLSVFIYESPLPTIMELFII